ncbi:transcription elongation factor NusA [bacterium SM23_31]|nr:MAG: transcription elongation factor NusA [bacterium SM23_31]
MNQEIVEAFKEIAKDKNIERDLLGEIIENIFMMMIKKKYGSSDNFDVIVNIDKGEIEIYQEKKIVEEVTDPITEISSEEAQKYEPDLELGDEFVEIIDPASFGRRLIISAKQNLSQKIKEAEKEVIFEEYKNRVGEIVIGDITQINKSEIIISLDKTEVVLPKREQISNERYRRGDSIRAIIKEVVRTARGPEIVVSRKDPGFLIHLFEIEVPEIYDGIIEIKSVEREAGDRTKIAVESNDKRIDPVGACVGMKGVRIQAIVKELNNEKIDIISYSSDPKIFITRALSPCKPKSVEFDEENKKAKVTIEDEEVALAYGRGGQNLRLASRLTGYELEIIRESELQEKEEESIDVAIVEGLTEKIRQKLISNGFETAEDVLDAGIEKIMNIPGIGSKTAKKIIAIMNSYYEEEN